MLKVTYHTKSQGTLERKVRSKIDQIAMLWDELEDFERLYNDQVKQIPKLNHIDAIHAFRLKVSGTSALGVWHYTPEGDPDKLIATIQYKPEEE